jgi:hypothetical protein
MIENYLKYCKYYKREISSVPQRERFFLLKILVVVAYLQKISYFCSAKRCETLCKEGGNNSTKTVFIYKSFNY